MRVAGYIRVSTNKEGQKESPENQKAMILDFITEGNFDLYDFYTDVQTGTTDKRDGLKRLIHDAENKAFDIIVAKELSRLGRNVELLYQLKRIAETKGIRLITLDNKVDTQDFTKQVMFGLYAWIYENESQRSSDRIKAVYRTKYKSGKFMGSIPPYGYSLQKGKLVIKTDYTVEVVRDIFDKYLQGWGHDKIASYLTEKDIPTPSRVAGKNNSSLYWQGSSIKTILQNPHYVGNLVQGRETSLNVTNKARKANSPKDWIVVTDTHQPIISKEIFEQVQNLLASKARRGRGKTKAPKHLFTNITYCSDCGKGMWYRANRKGYICGNYAKYGNKICTSHAIKEQCLIEIILADLREMYDSLDHPNLEEHITSKIQASKNSTEKKLSYINNQIENQMKIKRNALQKFVIEDISKEDYDELVVMVQDKLTQLEGERLNIRKKMAENLSRDNVSAIKEQLKQFLNFNTLTTEMLLRFVEKIDVFENKNIKIHYKFAPIKKP
ncbi:recombinase family protein [Priestia megaterium]|uniref:recombinase family protein n=1 Tax=Priestia megaterium TaxID=1404 RepID=UPI003D997BC3